MSLFDTTGWVEEFLNSHHAMFLDASVIAEAPQMLQAFEYYAGKQVDYPLGLQGSHIVQVFESKLFNLNFSLAAKAGFPSLVEEYANFLISQGKFPQAESWQEGLDKSKEMLKTRLRQDGSFKGKTVINQYKKVERNDPCPCGSGKKFKKCCGAN